MKKRFSEEFFPANWHGVAIDFACVLLNLFLFPFFNSRVGLLFDSGFGDDETALRSLSLLMVCLLCCRFVGLYFKRFSVQARLKDSTNAAFPTYFFIFNIPTMLLTAVLTVICGLMFLTSLGLMTKQSAESALVFGFGLFAIIASIIAEILLLFRLQKPLNKEEVKLLKKNDRLFSPRTELIADFGLFAYMIVWQVFYNQIVSIFLFAENSSQLTSSERVEGFFVSLIVFLIPSFLMFYLSPRTVFLIEDRKHKAAWLGILLVFVSSILPQLVFRILN